MTELFVQTPNLINITNQDFQIFATFGPTCHRIETLEMMLNMGMTGIRLNLSHSTLKEKSIGLKIFTRHVRIHINLVTSCLI